MASQAEPQSQPTTILPPLLALPLELKTQILSNFSNYASKSSDPEDALALMILRRTHTSFRHIIPDPWKKTSPRADHFLAAERKHKYLFSAFYCWRCKQNDFMTICDCPIKMLPCYDCITLHDIHGNFRNYQVVSADDEESWDTLGAEHAQKRVCDDCWKERLLETTSEPDINDEVYYRYYTSR